jgi:hypothetical protein
MAVDPVTGDRTTLLTFGTFCPNDVMIDVGGDLILAARATS